MCAKEAYVIIPVPHLGTEPEVKPDQDHTAGLWTSQTRVNLSSPRPTDFRLHMHLPPD